MNKTKHTPGPWFVALSDNATPHILTKDLEFTHHVMQEDVDESLVCVMPPEIRRSYNSLANAKLIAAAPELLEALQWLMDYPEDDLKAWATGTKPVTMTFTPDCIAKALNAIEKATK